MTHDSRPRPGRPLVPALRRTAARVLIQLGYLVSCLLGDDWAGRRLRVTTLRLLGARIGPGTVLHGGTYVSRPRGLVVGARTFVNRNCYLDLEGTLTLGEAVTIGHGATFVTTVHTIGPAARRCGPTGARPIDVGDGAWVGANVTVLPGVRIGRGAVVAAGAVVRDDVPPDYLVAGVPARLVRRLAPG